MPELRKDPVTNRWVIISTERGKRPSDFGSVDNDQRKEPKNCPFCEGNENKTPPEILSYRQPGTKPNTAGWWLRVVANKYPALQIEGEVSKMGVGMFDMMNGIGAHEVIIETTDHNKSYKNLSLSDLEEIIWAYRDRSIDLQRDKRFAYILIFKNHGEAAGASLDHPHSQLIATPIVPKNVQEEMEGAAKFFKFRDRCVFCDMIKEEIKVKDRVVVENADFIAFEPFASRFPFETWVMPKVHDPTFPDITRHEVISLAQVMEVIIKKIGVSLNNPPYNYMLHTSPCSGEIGANYFHWHLEFIPRLTKVAGFEWGSGFFINPTSPEEAAKCLRETVI